MDHKRAVILGCGSVGSLVAMELARSGVGHFLLADPDVMEYHNICRHQCGIEDVGDLKINALKRKLLNINPQIDVQIFEGIVQNIPKAMLDDFCVKGETVFVGCAETIMFIPIRRILRESALSRASQWISILSPASE